jgi:hypothetical protein
MAKKTKKLDNGGASYLGAASVKNGSKGAATRAGSTPKNPGRVKKLSKGPSEEMKRVMEVNRKKEQKRPLATGRADSFTDEVGQAILAGGRGFGVQGSRGLGKDMTRFQGGADKDKNSFPGPIRAKTPTKPDPSFIRKAKVKKSIVKK